MQAYAAQLSTESQTSLELRPSGLSLPVNTQRQARSDSFWQCGGNLQTDERPKKSAIIAASFLLTSFVPVSGGLKFMAASMIMIGP